MHNLEDRVWRIVKEIRQVPTEAMMDTVPYWKTLHEEIKTRHGSLQAFVKRHNISHEHTKLPFPSDEQIDAAAQIIQYKRRLIRDEAGYGKSAMALLASVGIEQILGKKDLLTAIVCPNYIASSWEQKLKTYTPGRPYLRISSATRNDQLQTWQQEIKNGLQTIIISYDAIFRNTVPLITDCVGEAEEYLQNPKEDVQEELESVAQAILAIKGDRPLHLIGDELQHAKNPKAKRSAAMRELVLQAEYFSAVTGNPFFDGIDDMYTIMTYLDPKTFPTTIDAKKAFQDDPTRIRTFLLQFEKEPVHHRSHIKGIPPIIPTDNPYIALNENEQQIYDAIRCFDDFYMAEKFILLQLAATDARLITPECYPGSRNVRKKLQALFSCSPSLETAIGNLKDTSSKYTALNQLVLEAKGRGDRTIIFSSFREGITRPLAQRFDSQCLDGSLTAEAAGLPYSPRDIIRLEFQTNPDVDLLVGTTSVMREGMDLHAANVGIRLHSVWSPAQVDQPNARIHRRGQSRPVRFYALCAKETIDEPIAGTEIIKREGIEKVEAALVVENNIPEELKLGANPIRYPSIKEHLESPRMKLNMMISSMRGKGAEINQQMLGTAANARLYAAAFNFDWQHSYSAHTARFLSALLEEIDPTKTKTIIDICSPATISRVSGRPTMCVDFNPHQLSIGRMESKRLGVEIQTLLANAEDLSGKIEDKSYGISILANALHYGTVETGGRKRMALEAARVANEYTIITLPKKVSTKEGQELLAQGLYQIGLQQLPKWTGMVESVDGTPGDFKLYATVCIPREEKFTSCYDNKDINTLFILDQDAKYIDFHDKTQMTKKASQRERQTHNRFRFVESEVVVGTKTAPKCEPVTECIDELLILRNYLRGSR